MRHKYTFIIDSNHFYSYNVRRYHVLTTLSARYYFTIKHCPIFASIKHEMIDAMYQVKFLFYNG